MNPYTLISKVRNVNVWALYYLKVRNENLWVDLDMKWCQTNSRRKFLLYPPKQLEAKVF
jgi:hypothetical protein